MQKLLADKNNTFQLRLHTGWRAFLLQQRIETGKTMRQLTEEALANVFNYQPEENPTSKKVAS